MNGIISGLLGIAQYILLRLFWTTALLISAALCLFEPAWGMKFINTLVMEQCSTIKKQ